MTAEREDDMRFMVLLRADPDATTGAWPARADDDAFARFNEALLRAGVLLAVEGLQPRSRGACVRLQGGHATVCDEDACTGEDDHPLSGFWLWQTRSLDEAIEWARRIPFAGDRPGVVEIRPLSTELVAGHGQGAGRGTGH
jgi:hypothetical protein